LDFSKFKVHDWLMIGGGAAMLLLGLVLDWTSVSIAGFSTSGDGPFNYFFTGGIAWILVVGVGVLALLNQLGKLPSTQPWPLIFLGAGGLAAILMILRILLGARFDEAERGIGMYGAVIWTGITLAGAFINFTASGGDLNDLKDMNKLKASFGSGGKDVDSMPPPPPPPPPPPSPPAG
jgi:peptidoglycan/LPS O-acetylase OafA/YrhL